MWDLPGPGLEPLSPALAGGFLTTAPPGKSWPLIFIGLQKSSSPRTTKSLVQDRSYSPFREGCGIWLAGLSIMSPCWVLTLWAIYTHHLITSPHPPPNTLESTGPCHCILRWGPQSRERFCKGHTASGDLAGFEPRFSDFPTTPLTTAPTCLSGRPYCVSGAEAPEGLPSPIGWGRQSFLAPLKPTMKAPHHLFALFLAAPHYQTLLPETGPAAKGGEDFTPCLPNPQLSPSPQPCAWFMPAHPLACP